VADWLELTDEELDALERPYTPRHDFQGISDEAELQRIRDRVPDTRTSRTFLFL
jgi:1-deoxyxylulose-5-phosphate synthase